MPLRVLVAEDNEFNAQHLERLLGMWGHRVQLANNGGEALTLAQQAVFDLLLLDIHMPELDGFQVVRALREWEQPAGRHLPVIALTARSQSGRAKLLLKQMLATRPRTFSGIYKSLLFSDHLLLPES